MALSEYFTDDDLITQLRLQFDVDEMYDLDWKIIFSHIEDTGKKYRLRFRGRTFMIDKVTASVTEVTS